jgi:hypothetical protein
VPAGAAIDPMTYFSRCLEWVREALPMPVLLATAHHDEAAPHLHVLMLPVKDGKHVGGALIDRAKLRTVRESFFTRVAGPAGLKRDGAKVRGMVKEWAIAAVIARCEALALPAAMGPLWPVWVAAIERDPTAAMLALDIDANALRQAAERQLPSHSALHQSPIALDPSPIALQKTVQKAQGQSCVALPHQTTPASTPKAASATAANVTNARGARVAVWAHSGCAVPSPERLRCARAATLRRVGEPGIGNAERMKAAQAAAAQAIARHRPKPSTHVGAGAAHDNTDTVRVRDEFSHECPWND